MRPKADTGTRQTSDHRQCFIVPSRVATIDKTNIAQCIKIGNVPLSMPTRSPTCSPNSYNMLWHVNASCILQTTSFFPGGHNNCTLPGIIASHGRTSLATVGDGKFDANADVGRDSRSLGSAAGGLRRSRRAATRDRPAWVNCRDTIWAYIRRPPHTMFHGGLSVISSTDEKIFSINVYAPPVVIGLIPNEHVRLFICKIKATYLLTYLSVGITCRNISQSLTRLHRLTSFPLLVIVVIRVQSSIFWSR